MEADRQHFGIALEVAVEGEDGVFLRFAYRTQQHVRRGVRDSAGNATVGADSRDLVVERGSAGRRHAPELVSNRFKSVFVAYAGHDLLPDSPQEESLSASQQTAELAHNCRFAGRNAILPPPERQRQNVRIYQDSQRGTRFSVSRRRCSL